MSSAQRQVKKGLSKTKLREIHAEDMRNSYHGRKESIAARRKELREGKKAAEKQKRLEYELFLVIYDSNIDNGSEQQQVAADKRAEIAALNSQTTDSKFQWYIRKVKKVPDRMKELTGPHSKQVFLDSIARCAVNTLIIDPAKAEQEVEASIKPFEALATELARYQDKVLQHFGAEEDWHRGVDIQKELCNLINHLNDIIVHILEGRLRECYLKRSLSFQQNE
ncbi:hypothetical protein BKA70DRAFT_1226453 [Coprinopsis sp. MPI-PUGE-AT-0042]|nr:hypothetical protein BKA70DRAFT_1226453 [Coprinopsis sp. MPI-PUGE-AT-0042]